MKTIALIAAPLLLLASSLSHAAKVPLPDEKLVAQAIPTLLTNTLLTMSSTKTTTLTVAAVIALAAIPFARQRTEARKIQEQLTRYDSSADRSFSNSRAAGTETRPSRSASGDRRTVPADSRQGILLPSSRCADSRFRLRAGLSGRERRRLQCHGQLQ